jgi:hypothetical protein
MDERNLNSWAEFKDELAVLKTEHEKLRGPDKTELLYRGQPDASWLLRTTLDRHREQMRVEDYYRLIGKIKPEIESMTGVEWSMTDFPEIKSLLQGYQDFSLALTFGKWPGYGYMAHLRHHGFPSPLLDWTRSPFIAAFFAFRAATASRVAIYALSRPRFHLSGNQMATVIYPGPYVTTHRRHVLQQSQYSFCVTYDSEWRFATYDSVFEKGVHQQGTCWKLTIPTSEGPEVLRELQGHNLNAFSLFGSEESLMEALALREFTLADPKQQ